jgi:predicted DNA-binding ribbon-helix-helix protein
VRYVDETFWQRLREIALDRDIPLKPAAQRRSVAPRDATAMVCCTLSPLVRSLSSAIRIFVLEHTLRER